jgi:hypothetical protein
VTGLINLIDSEAIFIAAHAEKGFPLFQPQRLAQHPPTKKFPMNFLENLTPADLFHW